METPLDYAPPDKMETRMLEVEILPSGSMLMKATPTAYLLSSNRLGLLKAWDTLVEELCDNYGFEQLTPYDLGALTANHTILGYGVERNDLGGVFNYEALYFFEPYQVLDPVELLQKRGHITLECLKPDRS